MFRLQICGLLIKITYENFLQLVNMNFWFTKKNHFITVIRSGIYTDWAVCLCIWVICLGNLTTMVGLCFWFTKKNRQSHSFSETIYTLVELYILDSRKRTSSEESFVRRIWQHYSWIVCFWLVNPCLLNDWGGGGSWKNTHSKIPFFWNNFWIRPSVWAGHDGTSQNKL